MLKKEQTIIFETTKGRAEYAAKQLSDILPPVENINELISKIESEIESTPLTRKLRKCLLKGVAFHHAGLLREEKRIVEEYFRLGNIPTS